MSGLLKRIMAFIMVLALICSGMGVPVVSAENANEEGQDVEQESDTGEETEEGEEEQPQEKVRVTVVPFLSREGEDKLYYGQNFIEPDYSFHCVPDIDLDEYSLEDFGYRLVLESEEIGEHKMKLVKDGEENPYLDIDTSFLQFELDENAPVYTIREYKTSAVLDELEIQRSKAPIELKAPDGYEISGSDVNAVWSFGDSLTTSPLEEGKNEISYYLRSVNKKNGTYHAIDTTKKIMVIEVDSIAPEITVSASPGEIGESGCGSISGSESAMYYFTVLPESFDDFNLTTEEGQEDAAATIFKNAQTHYGISGYGRVDGVKASEFEFSNLMASTNYILYAFLMDNAGNMSVVKASDVFTTENMALVGSVGITGNVGLDQTLTAKPDITSDDPGTLTFQWYRVKVADDEESLNAVFDETGGAENDDLDADDDDEDDEDDADDEEDDDEDDMESESFHRMAESSALDEGTPVEIKGATGATYKITKDDIGYRLFVVVTASNYAGSISGMTETFVPKLMPTYTVPTISEAVYSPTRKLSGTKLPNRWKWMDDTITPVYGNSGYRAQFTPENTKMYKTVIIRIKVPIKKKALKAGMFKVSKTKTYTGESIRDNYSAKDGNKELTKKNIKVTYRNNKKVGKATIVFKGIGNYKGTIKKKYKIITCPMKKVTCNYTKAKSYTGKKKWAGIVLKNGKVRLKKNVDYTIVYKNNQEIGTAKIIIKGLGNYKGKRVLKFMIVPKKPKITSVKKKKTSFRISWKDLKGASGYNVYISTTKSFKKGTVQEFATGGTTFAMKGLQKKTTYYVRLKRYKVVKGKTYTSFYGAKRVIKL